MCQKNTGICHLNSSHLHTDLHFFISCNMDRGAKKKFNQSINQSVFICKVLNHIYRHFKALSQEEKPTEPSKASIRNGGGEELPRGKKLRADPGSGERPSALTGWVKKKYK